MIKNVDIEEALNDYNKHTCEPVEYTLDALSVIAARAANQKEELYKLLSKHPNWDEEIWAVRVPIKLEQEVDVGYLADKVMDIFRLSGFMSDYYPASIELANWFAELATGYTHDFNAIPVSIKHEFPKIWHKGKKPIKMLRELLVQSGGWEDEPGLFQRKFAALSDMMSIKTTKTTLFISINPCHFLTMSNPKEDNRGNMLTSCHSLNNFEYTYANGCSGYATDSVTMICFTVDKPDVEESLNNRKTSRQLFMYKPGTDTVLQSRMYNSEGGTRGVHKWSEVYRKAVLQVIDTCEGASVPWVVENYDDGCCDYPVEYDVQYGFGGYPDWEYEEFCPMIAWRSNLEEPYSNTRVTIGNWGICLKCGEEINENVYCDDCRYDGVECASCGCHYDEDELYTVTDSYGDEIQVCRDCRDENYTMCDCCDEYVHNSRISTDINDNYVCDDCAENDYYRCCECGGLVPSDEIIHSSDDDDYYCEECYAEHCEEEE